MTCLDDKIRFKSGLALTLMFLSDVHLGHAKTSTVHILNALNQRFNKESLAKVDIIFISGDFFDRLLEPTSDESILIRRWVGMFLRLCRDTNTKLRILRGTGSHDWDQPIMFKEENDNHDVGCDLKYFNEVAIEHIEQYGVDILYVPDEVNAKSIKTWHLVQKLLQNSGLSKVDFSVMHGAFHYQLPDLAILKDVNHNQKNYESITRHWINIGHVHVASKNGKVLANGSFDRLTHGEEGKKGFWMVEKGKPKFIENLFAMPYRRIDCHGLSADDVLALVDTTLQDSPFESHVQMECEKTDVAMGLFRKLSELHPKCNFTYRNTAKKTKKSVVEMKKAVVQLPVLTKDNLSEELFKYLRESPGFTEAQIPLAESIIDASQRTK